jgi:hypothetical protein
MHASAFRRIALPVAAACALWLTTGEPLAEDAARPGGEILTASGNYRIDYRTEPATIPLNEPFSLDVIVRERYKASPARLVDLEVDADMPTHNHGMVTAPKVVAVDPGRFRVSGMLFHMPGAWTIRFLVRRGLLRDLAVTEVEVF